MTKGLTDVAFGKTSSNLVVLTKGADNIFEHLHSSLETIETRQAIDQCDDLGGLYDCRHFGCSGAHDVLTRCKWGF